MSPARFENWVACPRVPLVKHKTGNFEIGRILHLKSEIRNLKLDRQSNLIFRISDLRCRIRPISKFPTATPIMLTGQNAASPSHCPGTNTR